MRPPTPPSTTTTTAASRGPILGWKAYGKRRRRLLFRSFAILNLLAPGLQYEVVNWVIETGQLCVPIYLIGASII